MVAPGPELVHDPGAEPGRRIIESVTQRERSGALDGAISTLVVQFLVSLVKPRQLLCIDTAHGVLARPGPQEPVAMRADPPPAVAAVQPSYDASSPIATLGAIPIVAEPCHELGNDLRHAIRTPPALFRLARKRESGQRRADDVEGILG